MTTPSAPSACIEGYAKARRYNAGRADNYIRHTAIGDPPLDLDGEGLRTAPRAIFKVAHMRAGSRPG